MMSPALTTPNKPQMPATCCLAICYVSEASIDRRALALLRPKYLWGRLVPVKCAGLAGTCLSCCQLLHQRHCFRRKVWSKLNFDLQTVKCINEVNDFT